MRQAYQALTLFDFPLIEILGCGMILNSTVNSSYVSPNMTIQFCVEACRGVGLSVAAAQVRKISKFNTIYSSSIRGIPRVKNVMGLNPIDS